MEKNVNNNYEIRCQATEHRAFEEDGKKRIEGYALLFNHRSKLIYERGKLFYEEIDDRALDRVLQDKDLDVIVTPNHDFSKVMGRTTSGTLRLEKDERGLKYSVDVPDISYALDMYESIKRGDTFESSFTFMVDENGQNWSELEDGALLRTLTDISYLHEVGPVTDGAYSDTAVAARSLQAYLAKKDEQQTRDKKIISGLYQKKLELLKLKK